MDQNKLALLIRGLRDTTQSASNAIASNISGPIDLIAMGLRGVGLPIPEDTMGGSKWMADRGLTREVPMGAPRIIGETLGMAGPAVAAAKAPQIAAGLNQMQSNAMAKKLLNSQAGAVYMPNGLLSSNLDDANKLADFFTSKGFKPNVIKADGGSVYVTADVQNLTKSGTLSKRNPYKPLMAGEKPYKARFADHPSYWDSTVSSDPFTGNTVDQIIENLISKNSDALPSSRFVPGHLQGTITEYKTAVVPSLSGKTMVNKTFQDTRPFSFLGDDLINRRR